MGVAELGTERTATNVDGPGLIRAGILLAFGILITFTPQLHTMTFTTLSFGIFALLWAVVLLALWSFSPADQRVAGSRLLALMAAVAGALSLSGAVSQVQLLSLVIGLWALLSAAALFWANRTGPRVRDTALQAIMLAVLAVLMLFVPDDAIGVIGFFGGYCVLAGVFLAIGSFDRAPAAEAQQSADAQPLSPTTTSSTGTSK